MADHDNEEDRKMFVGGLPQDVSQDDLKEYFEAFGELESVKLKMDPMTGRSRGFAFLLYKDVESIDNAASNKDHKLKGKSITVKKADIKPGKIYVGKLPDSGVGEDEIKEHFSQYGTVSEVIRPIDKSKDNTPKNFCFVTFEKERVAKKLIEEGTCNIGGHKMQIKQVTPNPRDPSNRGGMGGGRGGYGGSPWMNQGGGWGGQGGGWGNDGGYGGFGGQGGGQWGSDGGYGGYGGGDMGGQGGWGAGGGGGGWGQGGGQQWGGQGQGGGTWSTGGRGGGRGGGGGKMRGGRGGGGGGGRGRGRGGQARPY